MLLAAACATTAPPPAAPQFDLQSTFLVNLHQRLLSDANAPTPRTWDALGAADRAVWQEAAEAYRALVRGKNRVSNLEMVLIDHALSLGPEKADPKWMTILDRAAPVYRRAWWSGDDAKNREWIAMVRPFLDEHGAAIADAHARVYGVPFPPYSRLEISNYAGPLGARSTLDHADRPHVTISSRDERFRGHAALEAVLHEISHAMALPNSGPVGGVINDYAKSRGIEPPPDLWHAILFFNTGELTRRHLAARGIDYRSFAYSSGVYQRMPASYLPAVEKWWPQVIDGTIARDEAIRRIVDEVSARSPRTP